MAATMWGADPEALDALARSIDGAAEALDDAGTSMRALLYAAPWNGGDADVFRVEWDEQHLRALQAAATFLRESARRLGAQALEQRRASEADGSAGAGIGMVGGRESSGGPPRTLEETERYLREHIDPDDFDEVDLIGKGGDRTAEEIRSRLRDALDHPTGTELTIIRDLLQHGMTDAQLRALLRGGHVWIADPELYDSWSGLDDAGPRRLGSSHYRDEMSDPQHEIESPLFGAGLFGRARGGTWIQLEMYSEEDVARHGLTYADYKWGHHQNVGPFGFSDVTDSSPIELGGHRPDKGTSGGGGGGGAW